MNPFSVRFPKRIFTILLPASLALIALALFLTYNISSLKFSYITTNTRTSIFCNSLEEKQTTGEGNSIYCHCYNFKTSL